MPFVCFHAENLIITRTFSKSYSLAGSRVGYAVSSSGIIEILDSVREVYNLDRMSQAAAHAALTDEEYFRSCLGKILDEREKLIRFYLAWLAYAKKRGEFYLHRTGFQKWANWGRRLPNPFFIILSNTTYLLDIFRITV